MFTLFNVAALAVILAVAIYTLAYAWWAARWGLRRGAVGLTLLGLLAAGLPTWLLLGRR
ncbi:MAG: hypothetical protein L6E13_01960 [Firmicutes bacterium]|nr:hypothetical protein [Bacillota bacterium]